MKKIKAIFIGASAGGVTALQQLFNKLDKNLNTPIVVVLHLPPGSNIDPALVFNSNSPLSFLEGRDKMSLQPQHVYFAPSSYHLLVEKDASLALSQDEPVHYSRPSIDVLFESAAAAFGANACGILLTGANADGASGLKCIKDAGGLCFVQDPSTAEVPTMPMAALALMKPDFTGSIVTIAEKLLELMRPEAL